MRKAAWFALALVLFLSVQVDASALRSRDIVVAPAPSRLQEAAPSGTIEGQVVNGSAGGGPTGGVALTLRIFQGASEREPRTTTTDEQGHFRFEGLESGADWTFLVRATYQDVTYSSDLLAFESGKDELPLTLTVYEATTSEQGIRVGKAHILVAARGGNSLSVTEFYIFDNTTDRTYTGKQQIEGRNWTSRFILPQGSQELTLDDGDLGGRFLATEDGFVDTEPQWPGSTRVLFSYVLDCPGGRCSLDRELLHPVSSLNVLIPQAGVRVESGSLALQGTMQAEGQSYLNYAGRDLAAGQRLDLNLSFSGQPSGVRSPGGSPQALPWIVLGSLVAGLVLVYPFWRQRVQAAAKEER